MRVELILLWWQIVKWAYSFAWFILINSASITKYYQVMHTSDTKLNFTWWEPCMYFFHRRYIFSNILGNLHKNDRYEHICLFISHTKDGGLKSSWILLEPISYNSFDINSEYTFCSWGDLKYHGKGRKDTI